MLVAIPIPSSLLFTPPPRTYMLSTPLPPPPPEEAPRDPALVPLAEHALRVVRPPAPAPALRARVARARLLPSPLPLAPVRPAVVQAAVGGHDAVLAGVAQARAPGRAAHAVPVAVPAGRAGVAAAGAGGHAGLVGARVRLAEGPVGQLGAPAGGLRAAVRRAVAEVGLGLWVGCALGGAVFRRAVVWGCQWGMGGESGGGRG